MRHPDAAFEAIMFYLDNCVIIEFTYWQTYPDDNIRTIWAGPQGDFYIYRQARAEVGNRSLYLPGRSDQNTKGPLVVANEVLIDNWLKNYKIAYKELNFSEAIIINLRDLPNSKERMETVKTKVG